MFYLIITAGITLDLYTKSLASKYLEEKYNILGDFLFLKYSENTWIAFSIQIPFLKYLTAIIIILVFYYYLLERKARNNLKLLDLSFWLILAWAIWNGLERILNSKVIDFIWIKYFAIFNLADIFITIWALIYLYIHISEMRNLKLIR